MKNRIYTAFCSTLIVGSMLFAGTFPLSAEVSTAPETTQNTVKSTVPEAVPDAKQPGRGHFKRNDMNGMKEKMAKLTDAQKAEIFSLMQQKANINMQMIDKYQSYGLIDASKASAIKARIQDRLQKMKENMMPSTSSK